MSTNVMSNKKQTVYGIILGLIITVIVLALMSIETAEVPKKPQKIAYIIFLDSNSDPDSKVFPEEFLK